MNEIEKLYELAGVKPVCDGLDCFTCIAKCNNGKYPEFTAEKQIGLIKFLLKNYEGIDISKKIDRFNFLIDNATFIGCHHNDKSFEESLAGVINKLWTDMSENERAEIIKCCTLRSKIKKIRKLLRNKFKEEI